VPSVFAEILLPVVFFALMCLPKALVDPKSFDVQLSQPVPLSSKLWSNCLVCSTGSMGSILNGTCDVGQPQGINRIL
jgi:hypothetical protein